MANLLRVLLIEDNEDDAALLLRTLERGGYEPVSRRVDNPTTMHAALQQESWDIILADWNLPQFSALFALEMLKSQGLDLPFIIVSGTIGEEAAVVALKAGAHDFVPKQNLERLVLTTERELREAGDRRIRRKAEADLAASEERLQLVGRATNDAVRDWDLSTNGVWWNEGFFALFGYRFDEVEPGIESWYNRLHPEDKDRVIAGCYGAINGGATIWSEGYRFQRADGTYADMVDRGYIVRNVRGQALRLIGAMTDLSALRKAHVALQKSEEQFRTVADWTYDWETWEDPQGRQLYISPSAERISGYRVEEFLADPTLFHRILCPEDRARWDQHVIDTTNNIESVRELEFRILTRDGEMRWIDHICRAVYGSFDHTYLGRRASNRDITERKQAEKKLRQTEDQLRQAQKMEAVGQLAGGVAHDFNNLLTVIMGYAGLMMSGMPAGAPALAYLEEIRSTAERASWLTRQLLAFSRRQILAPQVLDLNALIGNFEQMLHRLIGEDVALRTELAPARIKADPGQIEQVIMNLVVNARDAMPMGGRVLIETDTALLDEAYPKKAVEVPPGRYVLLAVSDTGCGMDAETQKRIFEPFFTTKEVGKGTGLGLSTVYGIVKQSNGFIWVYSEPGLGTTFKIYLPAVDEEIQTAKTKSCPVKQQMGVETILLVEDDEPLRALTKKVLELSGYTVLEAGNLDEALKTAEARNGAIHLLLTDVIMPGGSGPGVADRLTERRPDLKVLYMSGYTGSAMAHQGILESGSPFLLKPFAPDVLREKVREVLDEPLRKRI